MWLNGILGFGDGREASQGEAKTVGHLQRTRSVW